MIRVIFYTTLIIFQVHRPTTVYSSQEYVDSMNYTTSFNKIIESGDYKKALELYKKRKDQIKINYQVGPKKETSLVALFKKYSEIIESKDEDTTSQWTELFNTLIKEDINYQVIDLNNETFITMAARELSDDLYLQVLKKFPNISLGFQNNQKRNAFTYIGITNKEKSLNYILEKEINLGGIELGDYVGQNTLFYMLERNFDENEIVKVIDSNPKMINMMSLLNRRDVALNPLQLAAQKNKKIVLAKILSLPSMKIDERGSLGIGKTALMLASEFADKDTVNLLLSYKADPKLKDIYGYNSLFISIKNGKNEITKTFLKDKELLKSKDNNNNSPLHYALLTNNVNAIKSMFANWSEHFNERNNDEENIFLLAAKLGNEEVIKLFLERDYDLNSKDKHGRTALLYLTKNFKKEIVEKFLAKNNKELDLSTDSELDGSRLIHYLAARGHLDLIKELLGKYPEVINGKNKKGNTPLQLALSAGHIVLSKYLIEVPNIKLDIKANNGRTAVFQAVEADDLEILKTLHKKMGSDYFQVEDKATPLMYASFDGKINSVKFLLALPDFDINQEEDETGNTALSFAVSKDQTEIAKLLLNAIPPADPFLKSKFEVSPAQLSILSENEELIKLFYEGNQEELNEALFVAIELEASNEIFDLLISLGADTDHISKYGSSAGFDLLNFTTEIGDEDYTTRLIEEFNFDINKIGPSSQTPLIRAIKNRSVSMVTEILEIKEADPNKGPTNRVGIPLYTPLSLAIDIGDTNETEVVDYLVNYEGIDLNLKDLLGDTVLMMAIRKGYEELPLLMIEKGADFRIKNEDGNDSFDLALKYGRDDLILNMLKNGAEFNVEKLKIALKGYRGKDLEFIKKLIQFGLDTSLLKDLVSTGRRYKIDKDELFKWTEVYLQECFKKYKEVDEYKLLRKPASTFRCVDPTLWKLEKLNNKDKTYVSPSGSNHSINK